MDSNDQERERGITILAKAASITVEAASRSTWSTRPATPTSAARSSGRSTMVDGVLLLVDAAEGPLPQTRYVLSKALARRPAGGRRPQQGRPRRRPRRRGARRDRTSCSSTSRPPTDHIDFPVVSAIAREGRPIVGVGMPGDDADLGAAARHRSSTHDPGARSATPTRRCRRWSPTSTRRDYLGRLAIGRVVQRRAAPGRDGRPARRGGRRGPAAAAAQASPS